jgi:hypothetical protein
LFLFGAQEHLRRVIVDAGSNARSFARTDSCAIAGTNAAIWRRVRIVQ